MKGEVFVYLLRCSDSSLYCGISINPWWRCALHNAGKGAKAVRGKLPVYVAYVSEAMTRGEALKREAAIKRMKKVEKERLATGWVAG